MRKPEKPCTLRIPECPTVPWSAPPAGAAVSGLPVIWLLLGTATRASPGGSAQPPSCSLLLAAGARLPSAGDSCPKARGLCSAPGRPGLAHTADRGSRSCPAGLGISHSPGHTPDPCLMGPAGLQPRKPASFPPASARRPGSPWRGGRPEVLVRWLFAGWTGGHRGGHRLDTPRPGPDLADSEGRPGRDWTSSAVSPTGLASLRPTSTRVSSSQASVSPPVKWGQEEPTS